jgi:hypothetical protein
VDYHTASRAERRNPLLLAAVRMDFRCSTRQGMESAFSPLLVRRHLRDTARRAFTMALSASDHVCGHYGATGKQSHLSGPPVPDAEQTAEEWAKQRSI